MQQRSYRQAFSHLLDQANDWLLKEEWFEEANTLLTSLEKSKLVTDWWPLQLERGPYGLRAHLHSMENESKNEKKPHQGPESLMGRKATFVATLVERVSKNQEKLRTSEVLNSDLLDVGLLDLVWEPSRAASRLVNHTD